MHFRWGFCLNSWAAWLPLRLGDLLVKSTTSVPSCLTSLGLSRPHDFLVLFSSVRLLPVALCCRHGHAPLALVALGAWLAVADVPSRTIEVGSSVASLQWHPNGSGFISCHLWQLQKDSQVTPLLWCQWPTVQMGKRSSQGAGTNSWRSGMWPWAVVWRIWPVTPILWNRWPTAQMENTSCQGARQTCQDLGCDHRQLSKDVDRHPRIRLHRTRCSL